MSVIKSKVNARSAEFTENAAHMQQQLDDLYGIVEQVKLGGGAKYQERHQSRGKLLVRDRIEALIDSGTPF